MRKNNESCSSNLKALAFGLFAATAIAVTILPAGAQNLIAHYPLDSYYMLGGVPYTPNVAPSSPWGDATLQYSSGALYHGTISPGLIGNCYEETGNQARISFGTMDPFALSGSFTYALWVYAPVGLSPQTMLLSKQLANNNHYFRIILRSSDDMQIGAYNGPTGSGVFQDRNTSVITPDPNGRWTHIAVTGSLSGSTATWQVYADGSPLTMAVNTTILDASRASIGMTLGMTAGGQLQGYPGVKVDDIRFYDGVLSQAQILSIIPEPSVLTLVGFGLGGLVLLRRQRR